MADFKNTSLYAKNKTVDNQIKSIMKDVIDIFYDDTKKELSLNLEKLLKELEIIEKNLSFGELTVIDKEGKKNTLLYLKNNIVKNRQLLIKAYLILQNFRNYLVGSLVNYRYYVEGNDGKVSMVSLSEEELLKYLRPKKYSEDFEIKFVLNGSLKSLAKSIKHTGQEEDFLNHFNNLYSSIITTDMQPGWSQGRLIVHSFIIDQYGNSKDKTPPNLWAKSGKYKQFTKGHIFEGLDTSIYEAGGGPNEDNPSYNYALIKRYFYTKNLDYDSVPGFKGGDNPFSNTQIKSGDADLIKYGTIIEQIKKLHNAIQISDGPLLKEKLSDIFLDSTQKVADKFIDERVNELLKEIITNKQNLTS